MGCKPGSKEAIPTPSREAAEASTEADGKEPLTAKYTQRSQRWLVTFPTYATARLAHGVVLKLNKKKHFLAAGKSPLLIQEGNRCAILLTWQTSMTGKSVYGFFLREAPTTLGPKGNLKPSEFAPALVCDYLLASAASPLGCPLPPAASSISDEWKQAAIGADPPEAGSHGSLYQPLPAQFAKASFNVSQTGDVVAMQQAMEDYGFIRLSNFIPQHITKQALDEATKYFLGIMKSFTNTYQIDVGMAGFNELAALPSRVWEKKPVKQKTVVFKAGKPTGLKVVGVGPKFSTLLVTEVDQTGPAYSQGVRQGWELSNGVEQQRKGQPLATFLNAETVSVTTSIIFQAPSHYSPFAVSQKWGVFTSKGYQPRLGLGKSTDAINFAAKPGIMNAQLWMRNILASLHNCLPTDLCWQPDGVSFKAGH